MNDITIIPLSGVTSKDIESNIATLNAPIANFLSHYGLPTENILSPLDERRKVITSLGDIIEVIPINKRMKSEYLSKFTISVSMGMFDGALTFLWDEIVKELRLMIVEFDLDYFYKVAFEFSPRYKGLKIADELEAISEHDLLEICRRIGLLNEINHKRLETVNYFRNHASAAHPNEHELSGHELISMLENCIKYAIHYEFDGSVIQIKRLFNNIRSIRIKHDDMALIVSDLIKLKAERLDDFVLSIFGLYCDDKQTIDTKNNIENLVKQLWSATTEDLKYKIGLKFGYYRKHGESGKKQSVQKFLDIVEGNIYKDEDSLSEELRQKLGDLKSIHFMWNNFYNEYPHARNLEISLPNGNIPKSVLKEFVKVVTICYVGNGKGYKEGIDETAVQYYEKFIDDKFNNIEITHFINLFNDSEFVTDFDKSKVKNRMNVLIKKLKEKTTYILIKRVLEILEKANNIQKVADTTEYKEAIQVLR
jgi:hypothetical protein